MDALEQLSDGRLVSLTDMDLSYEEIRFLFDNPRRTCPCCGGAAYHVEIYHFGWLALTRMRKCHICDHQGLAPYTSFN